MTPRRSMMGTVIRTNPFRNPTRRRIMFAIAILISAFLAIYPQQFRSAVTLAPSDPGSLGLSGALNQLGAANSVFGNQAAVEITLRVAGSRSVRDEVIDKLGLVERLELSDRVAAHRWLQREVSTRSMRGGIVQMETKQRDRQLGMDLIQTYAAAIRRRLADINQQQTGYKRRILEELVNKASDDYDRAQSAYDNFRLRTRYSDPTAAIDAIGERIPVLQAAIKAKEVELTAARQFATDDNMIVRQIQAQILALQAQLAQQQALDPAQQNSVGRVVDQSTRAGRLERNLLLARTLYEVYSRYLQGTSVEDLTSNANLRIIEPPFVDTSRQYNVMFLALAVLLLLFAAAMEFYSLRPPLEDLR